MFPNNLELWVVAWHGMVWHGVVWHGPIAACTQQSLFVEISLHLNLCKEALESATAAETC